MRVSIFLTSVAAVVMMAATAAWAVRWEQQLAADDPSDNNPQVRTDVFARFDANADGVLTAADVSTDGQERFFAQLRQAADQDGDGQVTRKEYMSVQRISLTDEPTETEQNPTAAAFMHVLDIDRDGGLSTAEIAIAAERIRLLDSDGDGSVSPEELSAMGRQAVEILANEDRADREIAALFTSFDKDHDGQVTLGEAPIRMQRAFNHLDSDGNGAISLEEFSHALRSAAAADAPLPDAQDQSR